jgi:hypothetical protein
MLKRSNDFGYSPVAVEWDIWVSPRKPWDLARARIVSRERGALDRGGRAVAGSPTNQLWQCCTARRTAVVAVPLAR